MVRLRVLYARSQLGPKGTVIEKPQHEAEALISNGLCEVFEKAPKARKKSGRESLEEDKEE